MTGLPQPLIDGPVLSLATGADGMARAGAERLVAAAGHFGVESAAARQWLRTTANLVAEHWEPMLREAVAPIMADAARVDALVADARAAFSYGEWLAAGH
jgi:serine/threonine-protein kinase HipA